MLRELYARMSDENTEYLINSENLLKLCLFLDKNDLNDLLDKYLIHLIDNKELYF